LLYGAALFGDIMKCIVPQGTMMVDIHYWYWADETVMFNKNGVGIEVAQVWYDS
jgi:hypothetical protein